MWLSGKQESSCRAGTVLADRVWMVLGRAVTPSSDSLSSYKSPTVFRASRQGAERCVQVRSPSTLLTGDPTADSCETEGRVNRVRCLGIWLAAWEVTLNTATEGHGVRHRVLEPLPAPLIFLFQPKASVHSRFLELYEASRSGGTWKEQVPHFPVKQQRLKRCRGTCQTHSAQGSSPSTRPTHKRPVQGGCWGTKPELEPRTRHQC